MKLATIKSALLALPLLAMAVVPASADIYTNGITDGTTTARTINFGWIVSDSFTVSSASTATGVEFGVWTDIGATVTAVDWSIGSAFYGGDVASGAATPVTTGPASGGPGAGFGSYSVTDDSFSLPNISLAPGTYYLTLQNAVTSDGEAAYWDQNSGPSLAMQANPSNGYDNGFVASQAFTVEGAAGAQAPEPGFGAIVSLIMIGLTFLTVRHRRNSVAVKE